MGLDSRAKGAYRIVGVNCE